jgi:hypothetical protein
MLLNPQQQTAFCVNKCDKVEHECYLANSKEIQWREEQQVLHVDETGSQWKYKARGGVALVHCPLYDEEVSGIIYQASIMCDRLNYLGHEWGFNGKSEMTLRTATEEITMQRPSFGISAVVTGGLPEFTKIIEKEVENQTTLHQYILRREPWPSL